MQENEQPLVSIIAICHKHNAYVVDTLESIRLQTYPHIQLIIIDNHSEDGSAEVIKNWITENKADCIFIENEKQHSLPENCNIGLRVAQGKYFQGFSCDDIMLPDKIAHQVAAFGKLDDSYACVYGDMMMVDKSAKEIIFESYIDRFKQSFKVKSIPNGNLKELLPKACVIPAPSVLIRTQVVKELGGYDERYSLEDWPMFIVLSRKGFNFYFLEECTCKYRRMEGTLSLFVRYEKFNDLILLLKENKDYLDASDIHYRQKWFNCVVYATRRNPVSGLKKYFDYMYCTGDYRLKRFLQFLKYGFITKPK